MRVSARGYIFALLLIALIVAMVVLGRSGGLFSSGSPLPPRPGVNLIAYVDPDAQIKTIKPDGASAVRISPANGFFTWPMWSPDARQIVFSGTAPKNDEGKLLALYLYRLGEDQTRLIYTNEPGMGRILRGMPHYPLWAPDASRLVFMASAPQGLTLFLVDPTAAGNVEVLLRSAPLYASWSADSRQLLVHGGLDHFLVDVAGEVAVRDVGVQAISYRAPAWWPSGNRVAFVSEDETGRGQLYIFDLAGGGQTLVEGLGREAAFLWSPDGRSLAVGDSDLAGGLVYRRVGLFSPQGIRRQVEIRDNVVAFFWSPDSTKLAYVVPSGSSGVLRWMVLNVADGSRWPLVDFIPTQEQLTLFQFFDQFAYSHALWSPDSSSLVFAGALSGAAASASSGRQPTPQIFVLNVGRNPSAEPIAEGYLAVWSPR